MRLFEIFEENVIRCIVIYYSVGLMGKRKYKVVRLVLLIKVSRGKRGGRIFLCIMYKCVVFKFFFYSKFIGYIN